MTEPPPERRIQDYLPTADLPTGADLGPAPGAPVRRKEYAAFAADPSSRGVGKSLACVSCGYELQSALQKGVCPECGCPVARSLGADAWLFSTPGYVRRVRAGLLMAGVGEAVIALLLAVEMCRTMSLLHAEEDKAWGWMLLSIGAAITLAAAGWLVTLVPERGVAPRRPWHAVLTPWISGARAATGIVIVLASINSADPASELPTVQAMLFAVAALVLVAATLAHTLIPLLTAFWIGRRSAGLFRRRWLPIIMAAGAMPLAGVLMMAEVLTQAGAWLDGLAAGLIALPSAVLGLGLLRLWARIGRDAAPRPEEPAPAAP